MRKEINRWLARFAMWLWNRTKNPHKRPGIKHADLVKLLERNIRQANYKGDNNGTIGTSK